MNKRKKILTAFIRLCAAVFLLSGYIRLRINLERKKEKQDFENLKDPDSQTATRRDTMWRTYKKKNRDFTGWISIEGTPVDYPVMYTPDDIQYYLRKSFSKEYSFSGTPFIGYECDDKSDCFIIYAHNMTDGSMFACLEKYRDSEYCKEHQEVKYLGEDGKRVYTVFAALSTSVSPDDDNFFAYYDFAGELDENSFYMLTDWAEQNSAINTGTVPHYGQQILILSTCKNNTDYERFVVLACLE